MLTARGIRKEDVIRYFRVFAVFLFVVPVLVSCEARTDTVPKSDLLTLPAITLRNIETHYSDSGKLQLKLIAPLVEQYANKEEEYTEFTKGIDVIFYDGNPVPQGSVTGKYARYTNKDNLWELRDSIVVVNETGDRLETEILFWDQKKDLIYTDRFVKISSTDQIIQGIGFESDSRLIRRRIKKVTATITLRDQQ